VFVLFFGSGANSLVSRYDLKNLNLSYHMSLKLSLKPLHKRWRQSQSNALSFERPAISAKICIEIRFYSVGFANRHNDGASKCGELGLLILTDYGALP